MASGEGALVCRNLRSGGEVDLRAGFERPTGDCAGRGGKGDAAIDGREL